nr:MAG TPA: hypothetical protein [Bacteriophage sp.]
MSCSSCTVATVYWMYQSLVSKFFIGVLKHNKGICAPVLESTYT